MKKSLCLRISDESDGHFPSLKHIVARVNRHETSFFSGARMKPVNVLACGALTIALLSGCATADQQAAQLSERRAEVAEAVRSYANQLVAEGRP
ncbi:MAG TPA: hypothetical protein VFL43_14380, partial [Variovorax sp.]|nr:hypothetical protein [Variovorax sp.]